MSNKSLHPLASHVQFQTHVTRRRRVNSIVELYRWRSKHRLAINHKSSAIPCIVPVRPVTGPKKKVLHMNEQLPVSRRQALISASTATVIGAVASVTNAGQKETGDRRTAAPPLKLQITLTDGEIVTLNAAELIIDFGANGQLLVRPNGFLPVQNPDGSQADKSPQHKDNSKPN